MIYSDKIIKRFKNPKYVGELKNADAVGEVGNVKCGDVMKIFIKVDKDCKIKNIKFLTYGCVAAIAASDAMCELAKGKTLKQASKITAKQIVKQMGGKVPAIKFHCSILGTEALNKAIENYEKRSRCLKK